MLESPRGVGLALDAATPIVVGVLRARRHIDAAMSTKNA